MRRVLRRLYLAASELHPGVLVALLGAHMAASYAMLALAGEADLRPLVSFLYWYATTASTVGYGDLSPKSDWGRLTVAFVVMPGAIALFTVAIARAFAGLSARWRRRRMGLGDYSAVADHVVLVGYHAERTPRMIAELVADRPDRDIVLVATEELDVDASTHRFVRAAGLTAPADLRRAGIAEAARVIVHAGSDAETLSTTLAVTALNDHGHVVCFFHDADTARLLRAHCPTVEIVMTPTVELMVKALSDPGSTRLIAQLASHTDEGATLYVMPAGSGGTFEEVAAQLLTAGAVLVATSPAGETTPRFDLHARIQAGDRLFYVAMERVAERLAA